MKLYNYPMEMVCYFKSDGSIQPARCRVDLDGVVHVLKIKKVIKIEESTVLGNKILEYTCVTIYKGVESIVSIRYYIVWHKWVLYKI